MSKKPIEMDIALKPDDISLDKWMELTEITDYIFYDYSKASKGRKLSSSGEKQKKTIIDVSTEEGKDIYDVVKELNKVKEPGNLVEHKDHLTELWKISSKDYEHIKENKGRKYEELNATERSIVQSDNLFKDVEDETEKHIDKELKAMKEDKKYYTPEISEFHIGFEYEWSTEMISSTLRTKPPTEWIKKVFINEEGFDLTFMKELHIKHKLIRVPYLSISDIKELGWIQTPAREHIFDKGDNQLHFDTLVTNLKEDLGIGITIYSIGDSVIFQGYIKNKSTLIQILEMINVK